MGIQRLVVYQLSDQLPVHHFLVQSPKNQPAAFSHLHFFFLGFFFFFLEGLSLCIE